MNKDSLFFFVFMIAAMIYMVAAQRIRQWSDKNKKSRDQLRGKPASQSPPASAPESGTGELGHSIREILKRAAEGTLIPIEGRELPPLPVGRRAPEPLVKPSPVRPPPIPFVPEAKGYLVERKIVPPTARPAPSANLVRITTALRRPKSLRDAIILSEILQPPKALRGE
jgi:hypothetical protein